MEGNEEAIRRDKQRRYLQVDGARIDPTYHSRKTDIVPVNRSDLTELLQFDGLELNLIGLGQFCLAGGFWIFVERFFAVNFVFDGVAGICLMSSVFGVIFLGIGHRIRSIKQGKIEQIFKESTPE